MEVGYWEFGAVALAHGLAVASPGPDFALVLRQSLVHGRRAALFSAVGIGCGIFVHVSYSLLGLGLLVSRSPEVLLALKYGGAGYFAWLGVQVIRSTFAAADSLVEPKPVTVSGRGAWRQGFLTNLLNPKATLFFIALFAAVSGTATKFVQLFYGAWLVAATMAWFALVALLFTRTNVRTAFLRHRTGLDRAMGVVFLGFALSLALADLS